MILDNIKNILLYKFLPENLKSSLEFLRDNDFSDMKNGKYDLGAPGTYFTVQRYQTKPFTDGKLEIHKKYIDIQYILEGREVFGYDALDNLKIIDQYTEEHDIAFYKLSQNMSQINLAAKDFCIVFPNMPHMPGKYIERPSDVLKVVVKVPITCCQ